MITGDTARFAIEWEIDWGVSHSEDVWGAMDFWIGGRRLGNWDGPERCMLVSVCTAVEKKIAAERGHAAEMRAVIRQEPGTALKIVYDATYAPCEMLPFYRTEMWKYLLVDMYGFRDFVVVYAPGPESDEIVAGLRDIDEEGFLSTAEIWRATLPPGELLTLWRQCRQECLAAAKNPPLP